MPSVPAGAFAEVDSSTVDLRQTTQLRPACLTTNIYTDRSTRSTSHHLNIAFQIIRVKMDKFRAFTNQVSSAVTPFAARNSQWLREQTGNATEKTELPHDYIELETRIDALKTTHQKLLAATSQYTNEAYDYPPNIRESFNDLGKSISDKVCDIRSAQAAQKIAQG